MNFPSARPGVRAWTSPTAIQLADIRAQTARILSGFLAVSEPRRTDTSSVAVLLGRGCAFAFCNRVKR